MLFLGLLFGCFSLIAQDKVISGVVLDNQKQPIPGASIQVKGKTTGTATDINGKFSLKAAEGQTLTITSVGYASQEVVVTGAPIEVILSEDIQELSEVVVIGYGVQKKSDVTGAVASVSAEQMTKLPSTGVTEALQGRAAGVQISTNSGSPSAGSSIRIRGVSSINGQNVLWIVDGVSADPKSVNPADIESLEVLKDASTTAIYGASGANGVIVVTTKKGKSGKTTASLNMYYGISNPWKKLDILGKNEYVDMRNHYNYLSSLDAKRPGYVTAGTTQWASADTCTNHDYQDLMFRTAISKNLDFNISGGSEKYTAYFSVGLQQTEGVVKLSEYTKLNMRLNTEFNIKPWLAIGENLSFFYDNSEGVDDGVLNNEYGTPILQAIQMSPIVEPYNKDGKVNANWNTNSPGNTTNPLFTLDRLNGTTDRGYYKGKVTVFAKLTPFKGFSHETRLSGELGLSDTYNFNSAYYYNVNSNQSYNTINRQMSRSFDWSFQDFATYNTNIADVVNVNGMVGFESSESYYHYIGATRRDLINDTKEMWYFNASQNDTAVSQIAYGTGQIVSRFAYFGRAGFDLYNFFFFQGNVRKDYNSVFGPAKRSGVFPSMSAGFKLTELDVLKQFSWLDFAKVRYGWGMAGNNTLENNPWTWAQTIGSFTPQNYAFGNNVNSSKGAAPNKLVNTSIAWEEVVTQNIGVDLRVLNNRLSLTVDRFYRSNNGMIWYQNIPGYAGWLLRNPDQENGGKASKPAVNIGNMNAKGWEFTVGYKDKIGELKYDVNLNLTYTNSTVKKLAADTVILDGSSKAWGSNFCRTYLNQDLSEFYGYEVEKIFRPEDCDTFTIRNGSGKKYTTTKVVKATSQHYKVVPSRSLGKDKNGNEVFANPSGWDTIYDQNATAGDFKFKDVNGDGVLDSKDITSLGSPIPKFNLGLNLNLEYGWFDLNMFWSAAWGHKILNAVKWYQVSSSDQYNWSTEYYNNYYRDPLYAADGSLLVEGRTNGSMPRLTAADANDNARLSSFYVEDGAYLRLKNLQLGVTFPQNYASKLGMSSLRVYAGVKNLLTFTNYSGFDPEVNASNPLQVGVDKSTYPQARTYVFGVNLNF